MTNIKNEQTAQHADALIGAAQHLERLAAQLKRYARATRADGLPDVHADVARNVEHFASWRRCEIEQASRKALDELTPC